MIRSRKQPIRTYQRKTAKKAFMNLLTLPVQKIENNDPVEDVRKHFDKDGISNESLNYDLFETTFDKLAKEIVIPPLPPDINRNDSWNGNSSSDSDINNMTNTKSRYDIFFTSNLDENIKFVHKCKKPQNYESNTITSKKMLFKKSRTTLTKAETQSKIKVQEQKKQTSKIRKKRKVLQSKSKESTCNKQRSYSKSDTLSNLTDVICKNNISRSKNIKYSSEKILKTEKTTTLQSTLDNFVTDLKYMSSHFQDIKPCFVKLDNCITHNWHILNAEKNITDKQNLSYDTKSLQTNKDISEIVHNTNSQSIAMECNDIIGNFKNISFKSCSVVLCDNIVGNCSEKCNGYSNAYNKSSVSNSAFDNSSETISHCDGKLAICSTKRNNKNIIKDSFVKIEKLKIEEFVKKDNVTFNKKERHIIVSSTPIGKCVKPSNYSALFSPIDTEDVQLEQNYLKKMTKKNISNISNIASSHKYPNKEICLSIAQSKDYKFNAADIQEQHTQVLLSSQNTQIVEDFAVKTEPSMEIYPIFTQKYNMEHDVEMEFSLNTFANIDQSRFDDSMINNYNHSTQNIAENEIKNEIDETMSFSVDLHSKSKQFLNNNADPMNASLQHKSPFKVHIALQNVDIMQQEQNDEFQKNMVTHLENFKNETINNNHSLLNDGDQENIVNDGQFTQLQDSTRITRRIQYPKQQYLNMANISENFNDENMQSNDKIFDYIVSNEDFNFHQQLGIMNNLEHLKNTNLNMMTSDQFESFGSIQQYNDNINKQKSIFLKPGKSWTRSLSILNNIKDECNLDKLSIGKGRKWKNSVRDLLNMQKQGIFQSCLKEENNTDTDLSCTEPNGSNISLFDISKHNKTFNSTNHIRFSKRISVRVVLNDTSAKHDVKDTSFLEAFGISTENSLNSELSYQTHSLVHNDLIRIRSTTAKDVVLKKCAQQCYLSFSECFPNSYLEHCCKIGEGVYGEVFLYDYNNKKSVIKIIPIEGKELVNGEPQKKFNEILSEIVIAKELDNLRLNNVHRTRGFVEVKSIKCIIGKYPEKLVKLWNTYDEEKTSDNDCPSMFDENQLYIALELDHGGEDLEAFVFQTAREAHALFLQIALALAIAEKTLEFEHRDLHWGNVLISRTKDKYVYYNLDEKEIKLPSNGVKVTIIDFTLSRMLYQECCIYNDLALDPDLFTAHGEYQFEIYRLMRDKIQNNWQKFEPYTNILWLHYILDKMITMVRYKRKNLKTHKHAIARLKELKGSILNYDNTYNFVTDSNNITC